MFISEVMKTCGLTKKAINYYEQQGLLALQYDHNGYRKFEEKDVVILKEIAVLRKLGMSISDIKTIIMSGDRRKLLQQYKAKKEMAIRQAQAQYECLQYLLESDTSLEEVFHEIDDRLEGTVNMKDKLLQAFPGVYGEYLYIHFGKFLDEKLDNGDKIAAYHRIVEFLDQADPLELPADLQEYVSDVFEALSKTSLKEMDEAMIAAVDDIDQFIAEHKETLVSYALYRNSKEYESSPAYRLQQALQEFQKTNGYYDVFIVNMKIVSDSYRKYQEKLQAANERFLAEYADTFFPSEQ